MTQTYQNGVADDNLSFRDEANEFVGLLEQYEAICHPAAFSWVGGPDIGMQKQRLESEAYASGRKLWLRAGRLGLYASRSLLNPLLDRYTVEKEVQQLADMAMAHHQEAKRTQAMAPKQSVAVNDVPSPGPHVTPSIDATPVQNIRAPSEHNLEQTKSLEHADDFSWLRFGSDRWDFRGRRQQAIVRLLFEDYKNGGGGLSSSTIHDRMVAYDDESGPDTFKMSEYFRDKGGHVEGMHPAWGIIIVKRGKGHYALVEPEKEPKVVKEEPKRP